MGKTRITITGLAVIFGIVGLGARSNAQVRSSSDDAERRAAATMRQMTPSEKAILTHGIMPLPFGDKPPAIPADAIPGAGYVAGIPRLGIPAAKETDASLGVAYVAGLRKDGATALPSGLAMASSWNPELVRRGGAMIGAEARAKGFNVMLAGGVNLMRDPRNGRTFEYFSEDPLLSGVLGGNAIAGIQSNKIISTIKHFAFNGQETGRKFVNVRIGEPAARESDLLAFQIGIEIGRPGAVMCAYNRVNGAPSCASDWLLNTVLKHDWRYKGFVMSDWGAVPGLFAALKGLDQQSGAQLDPQVFFGDQLAAATKGDSAYRDRLDDMNVRILTAYYANGLDTVATDRGGAIDTAADSTIAEEVARQGIVLLRNRKDALPLSSRAQRIAVIGGYADTGVLSGAGSSQVQGIDGPAVTVPMGGSSPFAAFMSQQYHRSAPLDAIRALAPAAKVSYRNGRYISDAVALAKRSDVAIVFATKWSGEGFDVPDLSLPDGQDQLISAVSEANPNTIVVLETGNPIVMPWLDKTAAVVEAWYPGARGGEAIAAVLFGKVNPSGRLPITFPAGVAQLPRPVLDGYAELEPDFSGSPPSADTKLEANYDIEGSDVGYRWFARTREKPLFPFGFGLSYSRFAATGLKIENLSARFGVQNLGRQAGATTAQLYLVRRNGRNKLRLVGFKRVDLVAGATEQVALTIDPRLLADWIGGSWVIAGGTYIFALGDDAEHLGPAVSVKVPPRRWKD